MTTPRKLAIATLATGLLLAGCGSGSADKPSTPNSAGESATPGAKSAEAAPASKGECDIVSDEVVTAVLGVKIVRREGKDIAGQGSTCIKGLARTSDPSGFTYASVGVYPSTRGGLNLFDQATAMAGSKAVSGVGDQAVFVSNLGTLFVINGKTATQVQVMKGGKTGNEQDCVTVAKDVLSRLG